MIIKVTKWCMKVPRGNLSSPKQSIRARRRNLTLLLLCLNTLDEKCLIQRKHQMIKSNSSGFYVGWKMPFRLISGDGTIGITTFPCPSDLIYTHLFVAVTGLLLFSHFRLAFIFVFLSGRNGWGVGWLFPSFYIRIEKPRTYVKSKARLHYTLDKTRQDKTGQD